MNEAHADHLVSPCTITLGDEFQAVYRDARTLFADFCTILVGIHPARIRFSVGIGPLTTPVNPRQAIGMDGPAFHVARDAMDAAFKHSGHLFRVRHAGKPTPGWLRTGLDVVSHEMASWRSNRLWTLRERLDDREFAEYFLLGTLLSVTLAGAVALGVRAAL